MAEFRLRGTAGQDWRLDQGLGDRPRRHERKTTTLAKKERLEEKIRKGLEQLRQSGMPAEEFSPTLVPQLKERLGKGHDTDLAVIFALGKIPDPAAVELLSAIEKDAADKELRKEARRSLFKLGQRGVAVPREDDRIPGGAAALFRPTPSIEAYMSPVDGGGSCLIWIAKPQTNRGLQVIQAMIHDRDGLLRIGGALMPRKELRKMVQEIKAQNGATMITVPFEYADRELYDGYERARARGQTGLDNFHELRSIIATGKPREQPHPIYEKIDRNEARAGAWRETSRSLLDEPELRYWILTDQWLKAFLLQLEEAQTSRLVLNPAQKEERFAAIVRDAVKELCSGDNGKAFGRRMENMFTTSTITRRIEKVSSSRITISHE